MHDRMSWINWWNCWRQTVSTLIHLSSCHLGSARSLGDSMRVIAFPTFSNMAAVRQLEFYLFYIWSRDCYWGLNLLWCTKFHQIGSRVWPPDARNCWMFNAPLLGNSRSHGSHIMMDMSRTWCDAITQVLSKAVHLDASYGISNIFQHGSRPPYWFLKF